MAPPAGNRNIVAHDSFTSHRHRRIRIAAGLCGGDKVILSHFLQEFHLSKKFYQIICDLVIIAVKATILQVINRFNRVFNRNGGFSEKNSGIVWKNV